MVDFYHRRFDLLLCTTIIESGIDVPTANTIVINRADHMGLAQLHQLRGRVGRGAAKSYCILVYPDDAGETERLGILTASTDGFKIAEADLRIRGAGQFSGTLQAGQAEFGVADLVRDFEIYLQAKAAAETIVGTDPGLRDPSHAGLRALLERRPSTQTLLLSS
jgi:ATP-dependent DNA helicase RecG